MRRIIERKVTVVTTTTWTISWQDDSLQAEPPSGSVNENLSRSQLSLNPHESDQPDMTQSAKEDGASETKSN